MIATVDENKIAADAKHGDSLNKGRFVVAIMPSAGGVSMHKSRVPVPKKETVLLVDDIPLEREMLAHTLRRMGCRVLEASGALEAQHLAQSDPEIRLLFLDSSVTEPGHLQVALWFRVMHPEIRILVASTSLWDLTYHIGESRQITFLAKPYTPDELARIIRRILE